MRSKRSVRDILSGNSIFLHEYDMDDAWHCRILRSTVVRGRIRSVLVDPEFISAGAYLIQRRDIPGTADISFFDESLPILAEEDIHYFGQPIALLVAPGVDQLNAVEKMIQIRYDEFPGLPERLTDPQQIYREVEKRQGDPGLMWEKSVESVESSYVINPQFDVPHQSDGAIAHWNDGELRIITPTIWPHLIADALKAAIDIDPAKIDIRPTNPGIFHDHLLVDGSLNAMYAGIAADVSGRNIILDISEEERLLFGTRQPPVEVKLHMGLDAGKQVLVNDAVVNVNTGAFGLFTTEMLNQIVSAAVGPYNCESWRLRIHLYRSNLPPMSIFHGFPATLLQIPSEIQANRLAELSQDNPLYWRRGNFLSAGQTAPPGYILKSDMDQGNILGMLDSISDYSRRFAACELLRKRRDPGNIYSHLGSRMRLKGMGMAFGFQPSGFSRTSEKAIRPRVRLRMETDGSVHAFIYTAPGASAAKLYIRRIIRDELSLEEDRIILHTDDVRQVPDSGPVCLSRSITIVMDVLRQACRKLQKQRFNQALPIEVTAALRSPRKGDWDQENFSGDPYLYRSYGALALEVDVDPVTFIPEVSGVWLVVDAPVVLNVNQARAALEGGIIQCLDWVRGWKGSFERGVLNTAAAGNRRYPESIRVPQITVEFKRAEDGNISRTGQSGFRDLPFALVPAAYLSALSQATGGYFDRIPTDSQTVYRYLAPEEEDHEHQD
jgi:CO/xanthine dehydrogenase Mo-binding subunit